MTIRSKKKFIADTLRTYATKFRISADISVRYPTEPDVDSDDAPNPPYLNLEETAITSIERAFVGEEVWSSIARLAEGQTVANVDTSTGEYQKFIIEFYPALFLLDNDEFRNLVTATVIHELLHVVLFPLTSYTSALESK